MIRFLFLAANVYMLRNEMRIGEARAAFDANFIHRVKLQSSYFHGFFIFGDKLFRLRLFEFYFGIQLKSFLSHIEFQKFSEIPLLRFDNKVNMAKKRKKTVDLICRARNENNVLF